MNKRIEFRNPEFQADGSFEPHTYTFEGNETDGWQIDRDGQHFLSLGEGYTPIETQFCGVCSTDLARQFLPYPLPQIIGHEVVGKNKDGKLIVIEINASEHARQVHNQENPYDDASMHTHDPKRITLGINQLPGGFAPVLLAPVGAIIPVPDSINAATAALTEPFAAALQGVEATLPKAGDKVAVLGPRRLGALIIAALAGVRKSRNLEFELTAIVRHDRLADLAKSLGADHVVDVRKQDMKKLDKHYDIVFDTTGKPEGFTQALELSKRVVHLKSTNGQPVEGLTFMTDLVVDEMSVMPYSMEALEFTWPNESTKRKNKYIFAAPGVAESTVAALKAKGHHVLQATIKDTFEQIASGDPVKAPEFLKGAPYPRFDLAVASSVAEVDEILRPEAGTEIGIVRARGAVLVDDSSNSNADGLEATSNLWKAITKRNITLQSSRCGNFENALKILDENPTIAKAMEDNLITHTVPLENIKSAFELAADSAKSIKVLVDCQSR